MLNALRHQRFGTALNEAFDESTGVCSTPYGIRGLALHKYAYRHLPEQNQCPVLNALRHQRFGTHKKTFQHLFYRCSTPYGIRGLALQAGEGPGGRGGVLNALRHQRFGTHLLRRW